ncbi:DUF1934 domain-containing protein [Paenibacillus allorhizosphaerae]|uniref:DUF1934 domain-containing protein n=1 Tax=Paenibacillus allorhizosphaerae TaxID=2849866 RepID=A0ABN7TS51_9BACL|nr:DUF1934 domain-containing protein [Paenibacillus allorhizosphaerae]CAG7652932.1 hypothetical protein PAECIP111802_05358 [Paenibacillus allorhizosphaerae]
MTDKQTMAGRERVRISISSANGSEPATQQQLAGELFRKGSSTYLRYQELPDAGMGRTVTTLRIDPSGLRIVRQGDVQFEQTFRTGMRHLGYIQTPQGRLEIETVTHFFEYREERRQDLSLYVHWSYELSVMGEEAGSFRIELTAVPEVTA